MYSRTLSDKLRARPRRELDPDLPIVGDDFTRREPTAAHSVVAPRTIGLARKVLWWILGLSVLFCVAAVGFFAYFFIIGGGSSNASSSNIDITVAGPPQIDGGAATEFQISVTNRNNVELDLADLVVTFPDGTRSPTDFSTPEPNLRESLGTIGPGETRQGTVSAVLSGNAGDTADIKVELDYHLGGSNAIFVASTDYQAVFSSSPLSLSIVGNQETISGQPVQLTVNVASNVGAPVNDVLLQAQYPFGFTFASASPPPASDGLWQLGVISPGQTQTVTIKGTLSGSQGDTRIFHFTAGTRSASSSSSIDTPLADTTFSMSISQPFLGLTISSNGAGGPSVVVSPGDSVTVSIAWQNNLPTAITNAAIAARLVGIPIDGTTVKTPNGFYRSSDGTVIWDNTTDADLATLAPGAHGVVTFSFQMPPSATLQALSNPRLDISVNAAGDRVGESGVPENLQVAADQKLSVASDLELTAQGLYYANPFGSTGPMPPQADTETTYAVVLTVTNTTNKITGASVQATLPPYVRWLGIYKPDTEQIYVDGKYYSGGQIQSPPAGDPCVGTTGICWSLGDVDPGVGLNGTQPRQVAIAVGVTPSQSQIGQQPAVLQNITFNGTDASTQAPIQKSAPDVTTNIQGDPGFSSANAIVVK